MKYSAAATCAGQYVRSIRSYAFDEEAPGSCRGVCCPCEAPFSAAQRSRARPICVTSSARSKGPLVRSAHFWKNFADREPRVRRPRRFQVADPFAERSEQIVARHRASGASSSASSSQAAIRRCGPGPPALVPAGPARPAGPSPPCDNAAGASSRAQAAADAGPSRASRLLRLEIRKLRERQQRQLVVPQGPARSHCPGR